MIFSPNGVPNAGCEAALQPATMQGISPDTRNEAAHVQSNPQPNAWLWNTLYSESGPAPGHHARVARAPHMRPGAAAAPRAGPQVSGPAAAHPAGRAPAGVASGPDSSGRRPRAPARRLPGAPAVSARARRRRTGARPGREGRRYYSVHLGSRPEPLVRPWTRAALRTGAKPGRGGGRARGVGGLWRRFHYRQS